jgi:hypothetical protein
MNKGKGKSHTNAERKELTREGAFYFFTSIGNYVGESATSLEDFLNKIEHVDIKSLEFHLYRGDFEKWVAGTLGDKRLAEAIKNLHDQKLVGENLRNQLHLIVSKRSRELMEKISP